MLTISVSCTERNVDSHTIGHVQSTLYMYISLKFTLAMCMDRSAVTVYTCIKLEFIIIFTEWHAFCVLLLGNLKLLIIQVPVKQSY